MEKLEIVKNRYLESLEILIRSGSCFLNDLKTGERNTIDRALDGLESMVKEVKKASKSLNEQEAKAVRRAMR